MKRHPTITKPTRWGWITRRVVTPEGYAATVKVAAHQNNRKINQEFIDEVVWTWKRLRCGFYQA